MSTSRDTGTTVRTGAGGSRRRAEDPDALAPGAEIGRYVTLGVAGRGATGVVYRAYDPELDRRVALKVLHGQGEDRAASREEILREARALARLRHPNVVTVYDVGEHDGRVWVAMEYLGGRDLAAWLARTPRSWRDIAAVLAAAGRGLAAAHEAGIVHRDVKPSNLVVGDRGDVWVVDFGLARVALDTGTSGDSDEPSADVRPAGTPAYLAPELYSGGTADTRSDLYALCITLWEALYGARPWPVSGEAGLLIAKQGPVPPLPPSPRIPRRLGALLRAGLSADPSERPADLAPLLAALQATSRRRRWLILGTGLAVAGVAAFVAMRPPPCDGARSRIEAFWNADARARLSRGIAGSGLPHPERVAERAAANVDAWTARWSAAHRDACEATHVRREQSAALLDRRIVCLDRALHKIDRLLHLYSEPEATVAAEAPRAVAKLQAELACDRAAVERTPEDVTGAEADAVRAELDRVDVLELVADYDTALTAAREVQARAEAVEGGATLVLEARYRVGRLLDLTGDPSGAVQALEVVHWEAEAVGADVLAAKAGVYLVYEHAAVFKRPADALAWAPHVEAAIRRAGDDALDRAALVENVGVAHLYQADPEAALRHFEDSLRLRETAPGDADLAIVSSLGNLGVALEELHRYDEAIAHQMRALEILEGRVGEDHPHTARVVDNLGTARLRKGEVDVARELFQRARRVRVDVFGEQHRSVALSSLHLGLAALEAEDPKAATIEYERALAIYRDTLGEDAEEALICHEGLAHAHAAQSSWAAARRHAERALAGLQQRLPADHPELRALRDVLARADAAAP